MTRGLDEVTIQTMRFVMDTVASLEMFRASIRVLSKEEKKAKKLLDRSKFRHKAYISQFNEKDGKIELSADQYFEFEKLYADQRRAQIGYAKSQSNIRNFRKAIFINIFSRYDAFILEVIRLIYKNEDLLLASDRSLKYVDIYNSDKKHSDQSGSDSWMKK